MELTHVYLLLLIWIYLVTSILQCVLSQVVGPQEYCIHDTFNASCPENHAVVMETALYGRMQFGRCVREDHGHVGCSSNILSVLDNKCSGLSTCAVTIPIPNLEILKDGCPKEIMPYLEASYRCQKVMPVYECVGLRSRDIIVTNITKYLQPPPDISRRNYQGTKGCPWVFKTIVGQKINLTKYNFNNNQDEQINCNMHAVIEDGDITTERDICDGSKRETVFYTSQSSHVVVYVVLREGVYNSDAPKFLLSYQAVGCADIPNKKNAWTKRDHNTLTVRCNFTGETFFLSCTGTQWIGQLHDCPQGETKDQTQPNGVLILVGIGVALGVALGIILLAGILTCFRRNKQEKMMNVSRHTSDPLLSEVTRDSDDASNYYERRVQTLATIGRSPRVPREAIYKERVWMNAPPSRFQTLPCHYNIHQRPQEGSQQIHAQIESPYCSCVQQQQQQPLIAPAPPTAPNTQNNAQTSFITFRPGDPPLAALPGVGGCNPCGTGIRHITAARSLDLLKDSDHHSKNSPVKVGGLLTSSEDEDGNCTCKPLVRDSQKSSYQSNGYFDNSNNKSI